MKTASTSDLSDAINVLKTGGLVGMPTETVYGLAGDATRPDAVAKIYALKNRPDFNPLIAHVNGMEMALAQARFSLIAQALAEAFWPGPMTLVLPVRSDARICDLARAGLDTQALRWPDHPIANALISEFGAPLAAPSANKSGQISPTHTEHVRSEFGIELEIILEGGPTVLGIESTVLAVIDDNVTLLRPGSLAREEIESVVGPIRSSIHDDKAPRSPGMLSRHYAPNAKLRLNVSVPKHEEAYLGFGETRQTATLNLSPTGNCQEAAANLYAMLRELDTRYDKIAVAPIPDHGLGEAINDRLRRAAL